MQRRVVVGGLTWLVALLAWPLAWHADAPVVPPATTPWPPPNTVTPAAAPTAAAAAPPAAAARVTPVLPITVTAPPTLRVGETDEVVIGVGANAAVVGEIGFTLQFDANVLQVRGGAEGDWAVGGSNRFEADIASTEDRVQVRSRVTGRGGGGSVARVQFQAVAPGSTSVLVSEVTVTDRAGRPMPFSLSPSTLQVTALSIDADSLLRR